MGQSIVDTSIYRHHNHSDDPSDVKPLLIFATMVVSTYISRYVDVKSNAIVCSPLQYEIYLYAPLNRTIGIVEKDFVPFICCAPLSLTVPVYKHGNVKIFQRPNRSS